MSSRSALVVGATGLVGASVVRRLAELGGHARIVALVRRPSGAAGLAAGALVESRVVDFDALDAAAIGAADDVFACLGTTMKQAGSKAAFRRVDHDYTVRVGELARAAGAKRIGLVSSVGASARSSTFYLRVKGETERDIEALGYPRVVIARPSVLVGTRTEDRPGERVGIAVGRALSFAMVGGLARYRPISAETVARALVAAVTGGNEGRVVLEHGELVTLGA